MKARKLPPRMHKKGPSYYHVAIDTALPYRFSNVRLILWAINAGMCDWGLEVYLHVARHAANQLAALHNHEELQKRLSERDKRVFLSRK